MPSVPVKRRDMSNLGEGQVPWLELLTLLKEQDFQGPLIVDVRDLARPATWRTTCRRNPARSASLKKRLADYQ